MIILRSDVHILGESEEGVGGRSENHSIDIQKRSSATAPFKSTSPAMARMEMQLGQLQALTLLLRCPSPIANKVHQHVPLHHQSVSQCQRSLPLLRHQSMSLCHRCQNFPPRATSPKPERMSKSPSRATSPMPDSETLHVATTSTACRVCTPPHVACC